MESMFFANKKVGVCLVCNSDVKKWSCPPYRCAVLVRNHKSAMNKNVLKIKIEEQYF
jgi:hypothetical protein